jgi:hypothetical protein
LPFSLSFLQLVKRALPRPVPKGQDAPVVHVLHERHFGETLHHRVIVHQDRGIVLADPRDRLDQARRQIEFADFVDD